MPATVFFPTEPLVLGARTYLTAACNAAATSLALKNATGFVANNYLLVGSLGAEDAEQVLPNGTPGTTYTVFATTFAHAANTEVTCLRYHQRKVYGCATPDGTYVSIATINCVYDAPLGNYYTYSGTTYRYFKATYYNQVTNEETDISLATAIDSLGQFWYTTLAEYKAYAGLTDTDRDDEIAMLLPIYTDLINLHLFGSTTETLFLKSYTDTITIGTTMDDLDRGVRQGDILVVPHGPVQTVTGISIDTISCYPGGLVAINKIDGRRIFLNNILPGGTATRRHPISVTYTAGYATVPGPVKLAIFKLLQLGLNQDLRDAVGLRGYSIGTKRVEFDVSAGSEAASRSSVPASVAALLAPFKRRSIYVYD